MTPLPRLPDALCAKPEHPAWLWTGFEGESGQQRQARLSQAAGICAVCPERWRCDWRLA